MVRALPLLLTACLATPVAAQTAQRRARANETGAVTVLDRFDAYDYMLDVLRGHAPGLVATDSAGIIKLRIRGMDSFNSPGPPLVIIDGMPIRPDDETIDRWLRNMNPRDVARIEVLRDVASTSVYGTQGAHGVILIYLKRGL